MSKKKKIIVLSSMILLLAVTATLNFVFAGTNSYPESTETGYFAEYRSERSTQRNEQILQLDKIIAESEEGSEVRETAITQKLQLTGLTEQELKLETLIKAYGYEEVVVTMGLDTPNVNVVVKNAEFDQSDAVKIYNILVTETEIDCENVNIIPYL
ncbi:MAG: SpoIIIAH-like family protein [Clostridia bacterium]|nr:SpoIIIAH-like family protein [Clostridia bacterium]